MLSRRQFLSTLAAGSLLPYGIHASGLGKGFCKLWTEEEVQTSLAASFHKAAALGKPLLVFLGPPPPPKGKRNVWDTAISDAGSDAADVLAYGGDALWRALALCQLRVGTLKDVQAFAQAIAPKRQVSDTRFSKSKQSNSIPKTAWAVLIETRKTIASSQSRFQPLVAGIEAREAFGSELSAVDVAEKLKARTHGRAEELIHLIAGSEKIIASRSADARANLQEEEVTLALQESKEYLNNYKHGLPPTLATVERIDRAAAIVMVQLGGFLEARTALREVAKAKWWHKDLPGTAWGEFGGCGFDLLYQPDPDFGVACGMAHSPEESRRFLLFYTPEPYHLEKDH